MRCENVYSRHCEARVAATRQSMTALGVSCRMLKKIGWL